MESIRLSLASYHASLFEDVRSYQPELCNKAVSNPPVIRRQSWRPKLHQRRSWSERSLTWNDWLQPSGERIGDKFDLGGPDTENKSKRSFGRTVVADVDLRDKLQRLAKIFE
jgi:hypothetical protein